MALTRTCFDVESAEKMQLQHLIPSYAAYVLKSRFTRYSQDSVMFHDSLLLETVFVSLSLSSCISSSGGSFPKVRIQGLGFFFVKTLRCLPSLIC